MLYNMEIALCFCISCISVQILCINHFMHFYSNIYAYIHLICALIEVFTLAREEFGVNKFINYTLTEMCFITSIN